MSAFVYIVIGEALLLLILALIMLMSSRAADMRNRITERFGFMAIPVEPERGEDDRLSRLRDVVSNICTRAGIQFGGRVWWLAVGAIVLLVGVALLRYGLAAGFLSLSASVLAVYGLLQLRYRQRADALLVELPRFIDSLERSLGAGRSLQAALVQAAERSNEPLKTVLLRVRTNVELGGDLGELLQTAANTMAVKEFQLLALAINVHQRYGGSIKGLLRSIVIMVRQREQAQREFSALTGETRFSAWVLGLLPLLIAGYMIGVNPGYIQSMWEDDAGRNVLYLAMGFQLTGGFILWRMVKSI